MNVDLLRTETTEQPAALLLLLHERRCKPTSDFENLILNKALEHQERVKGQR